MKKKVLFALIALFSFVSAWAASGASPVQVGKYTVVLTKNCIAVGEAAPSVLTVAGSDAGFAQAEGVYEYDAEKKEFSKVSGDLEVGDYFLKVTKGDDTFYAPFQVGKSYTDYLVRVNDAESFSGGWPDENETIGGELAEGGAYYYYYQEYPWCDVWFRNGAAANGGWILYPGDVIVDDMPNTENRLPENADPELKKAWALSILSGPDETPYVAHTWSATGESNPDNIVFSFPAEEPASTDTWRVVLKYGNQESMPWGNIAFGESAKKYGLISANEIAQTFGLQSFGDGAEEDLSMVLLPQMAAYVLAPSVVYNGAETEGPGFALAGNVGNMLYDVVYVTEANDDAEEMERPTSVGTYYYKIKFRKAEASSNEYTGEVVYSNSFDVTGKQVIINPSRATKVYGEPDPDPEFAIDAASLAKGDEVETAIAPFLVFKRATGNDGEAVREYNYFIDFTDEYKAGECNYDIKILQNTALLVITKAPLHVEVTNDNKMWAQNDPSFADYTIVSGLVQNADLGINDTKDNVEFTITRPSAGTADGEKINADLDANGKPQFRENETGYPFAAEAANYDIIFDNAFAITPSSNTDGIKVTFDPAEYVYTGAEQKPIPTVKDGETLLVAGTDYDIDTDFGTEGYTNNTNVSEDGAICQIKLKGNYIATGDASKKQGKFYITKKALTVYATSYTAEPANGYGVEYNGFVTGEDETNADGFTTPAAPIVSKGASIEQDVYALVIKKDGWAATNYEITPKDGILALNNKTIIYARPDNKTQEYTGTVDQELTFATYTRRQYTADYKMESNPVTAVIGQPVYVIAKEDPTNANVGRYDITLRGATVLKDYNVVYDDLVDGYEITRKLLILRGMDVSKIYGDADPTFDALVYDGETAWTREQMNAANIKNNNTDNNGISYYVGVGTWENGRWNHNENVGVYDVKPTVTRRASGNYEISTTTENGKFTINPFAAKVTAKDETKQFGQEDPRFSVTITDNNNAEGHTIGTAVSNAFVEQLADYWVATRPDKTEAKGEAKGDHVIKVQAPKEGENEVKNPNFTLTFVDGKLTITPAQIAVFAKDQYVDYALDYDKKINPYDVIVVTPTETLEWQKSTEAGLSEDQEKTNGKIKDLVKLTVAEGKNKLGGNEDAFVLNILSDDYVLATEDVVLGEDYVYGGATIKNGFKNGWLTIYALETIPLENAELAELLGEEADAAGAQPSLLQRVLNDHKAEGVKVNVKLPARKLDKDEWYTFVLPFEVKPSKLFSDEYFKYGAAEILDASKSVGNNVVFSLQVAKPIPANTPFILKVENDRTAAEVNALVFKNVKIADMDYVKNNPTTGEAGNVQFVGLYYDKKGFTAAQRYNAKVGSDPRGFYPGGDKSGSIVVKRTNAYLQFPSADAAAKARIFIEEEDGTFTAINGVAAEADAAVAGEGWYTISGVKLNAQPTEKGIYIFNGKKVAIQ